RMTLGIISDEPGPAGTWTMLGAVAWVARGNGSLEPPGVCTTSWPPDVPNGSCPSIWGGETRDSGTSTLFTVTQESASTVGLGSALLDAVLEDRFEPKTLISPPAVSF